MIKFIILIIVLLFTQGCYFHREVHEGENYKEIHLGFPEFSDGKHFSLISVGGK